MGYTPLESIKTLSFATITNVIGSTVNSGFKTNARLLARGELKSIRASGLPDMASPVG